MDHLRGLFGSLGFSGVETLIACGFPIPTLQSPFLFATIGLAFENLSTN
jgi:hypothetical protein